MLTQLSRLGEARKITFKKAKISQKTHFFREGSALAGTMVGGPEELVTNLDVESDEPTERIQELVKLAEQTCYAIQTVMGHMPVTATASHNGKAVALD